MRISDWSSDVCSSDLAGGAAQRRPAEPGSMPRPGRRCVRSPRTDRPRRVATIPAWRCRFRASGTSGACLRHSGKLARFVPTFLTDAAETPRKNLRLDRHGDPWVAVHPVSSEKPKSELQSLMRISYAVFCLKKTTHYKIILPHINIV